MSSSLRITFAISVIVPLSLFLSCGRINHDETVNDLVREANGLLVQEADVVKELRNEFVSVFTAETRDKFPSNRDDLRPHAENQIRLLQKQKSLLSAAIERFERASVISGSDKEKRFTSLMAESLKKDVEIADSFVDTMNLILDGHVTDRQTVKNRFVENGQRSEMRMKEREVLQNEARKTIAQE